MSIRPKEKVSNVRATAVVHLTLRVEVSDSWGGDCPTEQVFRQARESAVNMINNALYRDRDQMRTTIKIVGTPHIETVIGVRK